MAIQEHEKVSPNRSVGHLVLIWMAYLYLEVVFLVLGCITCTKLYIQGCMPHIKTTCLMASQYLILTGKYLLLG